MDRWLIGLWGVIAVGGMVAWTGEASGADAGSLGLEQIDVFASGTEGYHTFRIPSVVVTPAGTVLAFAEGRRTGRGDAGDIDLVLRRSTDGGRTFEPIRVVWDDGPNTCGNPCPVIDRQTGTIRLVMTHNLGHDTEQEIIEGKSEGTRTVWLATSTDDGLTWSAPAEITSSVKRENWTWYATGPGAGIQLGDGRLLVPCDHITRGDRESGSHLIVSDDGGASWRLGGGVAPLVNECEVVVLSDGQLLLNMRSYSREHAGRAVARSADGGQTWSPITYDAALVEPVCQASIRRWSDGKEGGPNRILFSNPADSQRRVRMTVRLSCDDCVTWSSARVLWAGRAAYSCLAVLSDGTILCLYERGDASPYEKITLARFGLDWLTDDRETDGRESDDPNTGKKTVLGIPVPEIPGISMPDAIPQPTLGGAFRWTDVVAFHDWRIQREAGTQTYRLIDGKKLRRASGTLDTCLASLDAQRTEKNLAPMHGRVVLLLHGLGGDAHLGLHSLNGYLEGRGDCEVLPLLYASTQEGVGEHAAALGSVIRHLDGVDRIDIVAHSLGNLVVRRWWADSTDPAAGRTPDPRIGRIVMLGPPNHGAHLAKRWGENRLFQTFTGQSGRQLGADWETMEQTLATPQCEFGIIAGGLGNSWGFSPAIPGDDDGMVETESTWLAGAADYIVVPVLHALLPVNDDVKAYTDRFLREGYFVSAETRQPIPRRE